MRVLIAPDCFGGTLTASEAARAIADGWLATSPGDELTLRPLADGGPGFVEVLHSVLGGHLREVPVTGPLGERVTARWLEHEGTGYVESAEACGLHLMTRRGAQAAGLAGSRGVGELLLAAAESGVDEVVVGLGGSACSDGGAGMLAALGAVPVDADGAELAPGGVPLSGCAGIRGRVELPFRLVAASDVENTLLGEHGAAVTFGPQKGADERTVRELEAGLTRWAYVLAGIAGWDVRELIGAGAAGGLGAGLLALGARRDSGAGIVCRLTGLDSALDTAELVLTGEGSFDWQSLRGKTVTAVASGAAERGVPCLVFAGQVRVGRCRAVAAGVDATYAMAEHAGSVRAAMAEPVGTLTALASHVAAQWSTS